MTWWQAILLGIIQGITEFLPISSSGHLVLTQHYFGWGESDNAQELFFDGVLHLGTLVAVLIYFGKEIRGQVARFLVGKPSAMAPGQTTIPTPQSSVSWPATYRDLFWLAILVGIATLPAAAVALWKDEAIKESFKHPRPVAFNFIILGGVLVLISIMKPGQTVGPQTRPWQVLLIGIAQAGSAIFRGLSRSGMTISMSLLVGFERNWAVRFSFMMSIVASLGLGSLGIMKALKDPHRTEWLTGDFLAMTLMAMVVSCVVGYLTIAPLIRWVQRAKLGWFAVYLWIVAAAVLLTT